MLRIVFMGTPDFAVPCLEAIVKDGHEVLAVVTQPDRPKGRGKKLALSPVKQAALNQNIDVLQPGKVKDPAFLQQMQELKPDVIVVVAFGQLLPKAILDLPQHGCINVHASLLPRYRGAAPIHWSVINGETLTGVTTMYMDVGMDTGDMIIKAEVPIDPDETTGQLHDRLMQEGAQLLSRTLRLIEQGQAPRTPQNTDEATYASLLKREIEHVDWSLTANQVHNHIRGLYPWPGAYCLFQGKPFKLCKARIVSPSGISQHPGRITALTPDGIVVETGKGLIELLELQPESRQRMNAKDCANGYGLKVGQTLC